MKPNFSDVVKRYVKLVYFFAYRWSGGSTEEIEDIVQETFYKALQKYDSFTFSSESELKGWLLTICRNHIYNLSREKKVIILDADEMESIPDEKDADTFLEELIKKEQIQLVYAYLEKRPFAERELIRLAIYEKLRFKEIGVILECSPDAAKKRFYRIIEKMRKEINR